MTLTYRRTDHTADFGMEIYGQSSAGLFENAAHALFDQIIDPAGVKGVQEENLTINGTDWPDLMVNWLRELLFLWAGRQEILCEAVVDELTGTRLSARIKTAAYNPDRDSVLNEIKAVTYHQIDVSEIEDHWEARIIFDV